LLHELYVVGALLTLVLAVLLWRDRRAASAEA
jgi:hypothetical protein